MKLIECPYCFKDCMPFPFYWFPFSLFKINKKCQICGGKIAVSFTKVLYANIIILTTVIICIGSGAFIYHHVSNFNNILPNNILEVLLFPIMFVGAVVLNYIVIPKCLETCNIKLIIKRNK